MRTTFFVTLAIGTLALAGNIASAASGDIIIRDVNLGQCTHYSDGCNTCTVGSGGTTACTQMACVWAGIPKCLDSATGSTDDTQLINLENSGATAATTDLKSGFKLQKFSSCEDLDTVMSGFISSYLKRNPYG